MAEASGGAVGMTRADITIDENGWFKAVSPQFLALIDRPVEALAGVGLVDLAHPLDAPKLRAFVAALPEQGSGSVATRLLTSGDRWLSVDVIARRHSGGRFTLELVTQSPKPLHDVVPATPSDSSDEFPYEDSPEHMAYVASMPGDDVPDLRAAVRASAGDGQWPMLEIDPDGRTTFVAGPWSTLTNGDTTGADVFEEFLEQSGQGDAIMAGLSATLERAEAGDHEVRVPGLPPRWVRLLPMPSPHLDGVVHALVAVVPESGLRDVVPIRKPTAGRADEIGGSVDPFRDDVPGPAVTAAVTAAAPFEAVVAEDAAAGVAVDAVSTDDLVSDERAEAAEVAGSESDADAQHVQKILRRLGLGVIVVGLILVGLFIFGRNDDEAGGGPITVDLPPTEAVRVADGQLWRPIDVEGVDEVHAVATTDDGGAYVAGLRGRVVRLDPDGAALRVVSLGGGAATIISDLVVQGDVAWALDAGTGTISRFDSDGNVSALTTNPSPLLNARGLGAGSDGSVWVAATASAQVTNIGPDGSIRSVVATPGRQPADVVEVNGLLWVVDAEGIELVQLATDGTEIQVVPLETFTSLEAPHLAVVGGRLWITEPELSAAVAVDLSTGELSGHRIEFERSDGTPVRKAIGIAATPDGRLWIVDSTGPALLIVDP